MFLNGYSMYHNSIIDKIPNEQQKYGFSCHNLARPNVTLYSALSVGMASFFGETIATNLIYPEHRHPWFSDALNRDHEPTLFSMLHVTLFGLKASYKHFFGSLELGAGYKGLGSIGVGYEF